MIWRLRQGDVAAWLCWQAARANNGLDRSLQIPRAAARITFQERATLKVELAKPLGPRPYTEPDNGWRVFVALSKEF